jgi:hypothetical protein
LNIKGDYIPPIDFVTANLVPRFRNIMTTLGGIALQDSSYDVLNFPCAGDSKRTYSDVVAGQLRADAAGNKTVGSEICNPIITSKTTSKVGVKTTTSGGGTIPTRAITGGAATVVTKTGVTGVTRFAPTASKNCPGNICVSNGGIISYEIGWNFLLALVGILL